MNKKFELNIAIILAILLLSVTIIPSSLAEISKPQINDEKMDTTNVALSENITIRYLNTLGFNKVALTNSVKTGNTILQTYTDKSETPATLSVKSELQTKVGLNKSYSYRAEVQADEKTKYQIEEFMSQTKEQSTVITDKKEVIQSADLNFSSSSKIYSTFDQNNSKSNGQPINHINAVDCVTLLSNKTGTYSYDIKKADFEVTNQTNILKGYIIVDQNFTQPYGQSSITFSPAKNGTGLKFDLTLPNGTIIDPGLTSFSDSRGDYALYGWWLWWEDGWEIPAGLLLLVVGGALTILAPETPFGWFLDATDVLIWNAGIYTTTDNMHIIYIEIVMWYGLVPAHLESGYLTDQIASIPYPEYLGEYYYIPQVLAGMFGGPRRTEIWPPGVPIPTNTYYLDEVTWTNTYGAAYIENEHNIEGSTVDGLYAHLHACSSGCLARLKGTMNQQASGHIEVVGHSGEGYYSELITYTSSDGNNWDLASDVQYITENGDILIDCGYAYNFNYIILVSYSGGYSSALYLDAVRVTG